MRVELIPILPTPDGCKQIADPRLVEECSQLNSNAFTALQQELLPVNFGDMQRTDVLTLDDGSSGSGRRGFTTVYARQSIPPKVVAVWIEQFRDAQSAIEHFDDISRAIPGYDPATVSEAEPIHTQRIKQIVTPPSSRAFWISNNRLILIVFDTPVPDRDVTMLWLMRDPSTLKSPSQ